MKTLFIFQVFNYGRIYGAGRQFAQKLLLQFNPNMSPEEAFNKAKTMYEKTKGTKEENEKGIRDINDKLTKHWSGGTESEMFNKLEEIAKSDYPKTPVLESSITKCLEPNFVNDDVICS